MRIPRYLLPHTLTIRTPTGSGARGALFAPPVTRASYVEDKRSLTIDQRTTGDTAGTQITASAKVFLQIDDHDLVPPGAEVDYAGRTYEVAARDRYEHPAAPSYVELRCV